MFMLPDGPQYEQHAFQVNYFGNLNFQPWMNLSAIILAQSAVYCIFSLVILKRYVFCFPQLLEPSSASTGIPVSLTLSGSSFNCSFGYLGLLEKNESKLPCFFSVFHIKINMQIFINKYGRQFKHCILKCAAHWLLCPNICLL